METNQELHTHLYIDPLHARDMYYTIFTPKSKEKGDWYHEIPENKIIIDFDYDSYIEIEEEDDEDEYDNDDWMEINHQAIKKYLIAKYPNLKYVLIQDDDDWEEI